jgi:uncharacterized membrane protein
MDKDRLLAFSDGVIAIIITIMVLEMKAPHEATWSALAKLAPVFGSYVLSFIYVAIYWNNHHHLMQTAGKVNGGILWANTHLLFWLSLIPFATAWTGENHFENVPTAVYGFSLLMPAIAYYVLERVMLRDGNSAILAQAVGNDLKGKLSPIFYICGIAISFYRPWMAILIYASVALMWLIPDRRIERTLARADAE